MKVFYTGHLKFRIKVRRIPFQLPRRIVKTAVEHYFDNQTNHLVAVKLARYSGKLRWMAVTYDKIGSDRIEVITIHPFDRELIENRVSRGRWEKYEK